MKVLAVLITCHNRKEKTMACLDRLFQQALPPAVALKVYLVDDGCTDGTGEAVHESYSSVSVISGDGSLFWCPGMRLAWTHAAQANPDYYFWLNDDTNLRQGALAAFLGIAENARNPDCIVVGSCCDANTGAPTYGGQKLLGKHPAKLSLVKPDPVATKACDTMNGNCVLVTRAVYQKLGNMRYFRHSIGDIDYGLRARRIGIPVLLAPGILAECAMNSGQWRNRKLSRTVRFRSLIGRKGLPAGDWWRFLWTHAGLRALIHWPAPYIHVALGL